MAQVISFAKVKPFVKSPWSSATITNTRPLCTYMTGKCPIPVNCLSGKFPEVSRGGGMVTPYSRSIAVVFCQKMVFCQSDKIPTSTKTINIFVNIISMNSELMKNLKLTQTLLLINSFTLSQFS